MGSALFYKPDHYFDEAPWRREPGGGPILINLIHEIGNLRSLCGEIVAVQAFASNATRGFRSRTRWRSTCASRTARSGTFMLSDTAASGRSWEQTSQENKSLPALSGRGLLPRSSARAARSPFPTMRLKLYDRDEDRSWWKPFRTGSRPSTAPIRWNTS